ncbi:alpha/beta fold hydrolase [Spirosoma validum]|uniref:Alpha/beta hydrolase n=1 Tax=Spirosoma validum TaxID=2771355 RepID=A0A927B3X6_9BACT|nr:alpha/beta hydrolase [Spirosoma validum]MBD2754933.1 alpha/beta hydrolase [Spirosoma validum]
MTKTGNVSIQGFTLRYRIEGEGIPTVVIGDSVYYPKIFSGIIRQYLQLIFIDHRGFVPPPPDHLKNDDVSLNVLLDDIELIRKTLNLNCFIILGHSGHAFMALEYAKKYPQYVSHVVMIGASPDYSAATAQARMDYFEKDATLERKAAFQRNMAQLPAKIEADPERRFVHMCVCAGPISWYDHTFDATPLWEGVYTNMQILDHVWGVVFRDIDITQNLDSFDRPVFLALGKYDYLTGLPFLWDQIKTQFNDLTIQVFNKSAHTPQFEEPDLFNQALINWIHQH